jgi:hypothetical protein
VPKFVVLLLTASVLMVCSVNSAPAAQILSGTGVPRASLYHGQAALYARAHNIPLDVATERLEWQRLAPTLQERARRRLGRNFGGLWIEGTKDGQIRLAVTSSSSVLHAEVKKIVAALGLAGGVEIVQVQRSEAELDEIANSLGAELSQANLGAEAFITAGPAPVQNAVRLLLPRYISLTLTQKAFVANARARYANAIVTGFYNGRQATALACVYPFCTLPLRAGVKIERPEGGFCTAGFLARGKADGKLRQLTAGHCLSKSYWGTRLASKEPLVEIGDWEKGSVGLPGDAGIYEIGNDAAWHARPWVYWAGYSESYPTFSDADPVKGQEVCVSGASYGTTSCGEVLSALESVPISYEGIGVITVKVARANFCSKSGDSGAPVHYYGVAYGLLTAGSGECTSYFTPIHAAEELMNVNVRHESECDALFESSVKLGDMTGDGKVDVFQFPGSGGKGYGWESKGTSYSSLGEVASGTGSPYQVRIADFDGDGDDDLLQVLDDGRIHAWESKGTSYTGLGEISSGLGSACDTRVADINGDAKDDLLRFTNDGYAYGWLANKGKYESIGQVGTGFGSTYQDRTGDMNGDGDDDLFQILDNGKVYKWDSNGSSYSGGAELFSGVGNAYQVRFADTEGDGDDDIFRFTDTGVASLWKSKGSAYESIGTIATGLGVTRQMRVADIDGDGDADILKFADDGNGYAWKFNGSTYESIGKVGSGFGAP